jgi:predicted transcriptional regulator
MVRWDLISFVKRSSQRKKILEALQEPTTPSHLARKTGLYLTHVSRTLRELVDKELVECLTPKETMEKYYRITKLGRNVLQKIDNLSQS